jgi:hypothetical protein
MHINKNINIKTCRIALGGTLVCHTEGRTQAEDGEIFGAEGDEVTGECRIAT